MSAENKLYVQFVWEDVELNKVRRTCEAPNVESAVAFGVKHNALYFTTYKAEAPDDALADKGGRIYTATMEARLLRTADIIAYLEQDKTLPHMMNHHAPILPRMFGRLSRDQGLQDKFNTASATPGAAARYDAILDLLKQEAPDQVFLGPGHGGFIRLEKDDASFGRDLAQRHPPQPKAP